jgi:(5-formylfuran-3-yl)methyl phosphate synthase
VTTGARRPQDCRVTTSTTIAELPPRLLVSVGSIADLDSAVRGGADLLHLDAAAIGLAGPDRLRELVEFARLRAPWVGVCVALGTLPDATSEQTDYAMPAGARWVTLDVGNEPDPQERKSRFLEYRERVETASGRPLRWILLAPVDQPTTGGSGLGGIIDLAIQTDAAGVWLTTTTSEWSSLADHLSPCAMSRFAWMAREHCLPLFFGGAIGLGDLEWMTALEPAVVALPNYVAADLSATAVETFKRSLDDAASV